MLGARKALGLAMEERSVRATEIRLTREGCEAVGAAELRFPEGLSLEEPARLGRALRQFLLEHHFSAKRAVVGLPAKWLLVKEKQVPPASAESLVGILRIEAEREFSSDFTDLASDYADASDPEQSRPVLLVATQRERLEQIVAMARVARLRVQAITSSAMTVASAADSQGSKSGFMLHLTPAGAEFTVQDGKQFRVVRHLPLAVPFLRGKGSAPDDHAIEGIANEVRRIVSLLPPGRSPSRTDGVSIWDEVGLESAALRALGDRLGVRVSVGKDLSALGIAESHPAQDPQAPRFAAAAALGLAGVQPGRLAIDFLHSRLAPTKKTVLRGHAVWAVGIAVALMIAGLSLFVGWESKKREVAGLANGLDAMKEDIEAARDVVGRVSLARGWYDRRPRFLDCLRALTLAFPEEGRIWTNSLMVKEDMTGVVSGKSVDERSVLELLDAIKGFEAFSDVKLEHMREAGGRIRAVSFAIKFSFLSTE